MIESVQVRHRGAYDFETHYNNLCALQDSCPLPAVKAHLSQGVLDLNGDRIRANDWMPVLNTVRINKCLEFVAFRSYYTPPSNSNEKKAQIERRKSPAVRSKEITYRMCKALKECLGVTPALTCLELQGLPLRERDLNTLMKGLVKNNTLTHVSLEYCRIGDNGLEIICKGIKNSTSINSVNFTGCSLTSKGAESLAKVIKHQGTRRHNEAWQDSLRYRRPDLDKMPGLRRITINNNPMIGDQGAAFLAEALKSDLWLKALDMQGNGISSSGAKALLDLLKYNTTLVVLDVLRNPLIDRDLVHAIMEQLMINYNEQDAEYKWIKAEEPVDKGKQARKKKTKTLNSSFGRKTTIKITAGTAARRRTRSAESVQVSRQMKPISSEGVKAGPGLPWRTAARANRYRGYPPEHVPGHTSLMEKCENYSPHDSVNHFPVNNTHGDEEQTTEESLDNFEWMKLDDSSLSTAIKGKGLQVELVQLRRQINEERLARHRGEQRVIELTLDNKRLREENSQLKRNKVSVLDDDNVLASIEASFKQFHEFLDLLRDAGLGKLITMAGLDAEDSPFNHSSRDHIPKIQKRIARSNGFSGDISSAGDINQSHNIPPKVMNGNIRQKPYFQSEVSNIKDPTMKNSFIGDLQQNEAQKQRDELYERILQETSKTFRNNGEQDVTVNITDTVLSHDKSAEDNRENFATDDISDDEEDSRRKFHKSPVKQIPISRIPRLKGQNKRDESDHDNSVSEKFENLKGPGGEIIMSLSPMEDEDDKNVSEGESMSPTGNHESPDKGFGKGSRISDFSYGMDSFEQSQSYVSERGEVVHLGDDDDFFPESPSPIQQDSDIDEEY